MLRSRSSIAVLVAGAGFSLALLCHLFVPLGSKADEPSGDTALLETVVRGLRKAAASISSGVGNVTVTNYHRTSSGVVETRLDYHVAFSGDRFRFRHRTLYVLNEADEQGPYKTGSTNVREASYDGNRAVSYDQATHSAVISEKPDSPQRAAWRSNFRWPCRGTLDLDVESIDKMIQDGLHVARREVVDGHDCVVLEISTVTPSSEDGTPITSTWQYWVDTSAGFTVRQSKWFLTGGVWGEQTLRAEWHMQVRNCDNELWVPVEYEEVYYTILPGSTEASVQARKTVRYSADFSFNVPVGGADLQIDLPSSTHVRDEILHARYTVP